MEKSKKANIIKTIMIFSLSCFVGLLFVEIILRVGFNIDEKEKAKLSSNYYLETKEDGKKDFKCIFEESILPHPNFSFIYKKHGRCANPDVRRFGFESVRDFPQSNSSDYYDLLILGGSVAHLSNMYLKEGVPYLEYVLNKNYISPNGKPFRIFNSAAGANGLPVQLNVMNYFGDLFDGFLALDGFNEYLTIVEIGRLDMPAFDPFIAAFYINFTNNFYGFRDLMKFSAFIKESSFGDLKIVQLAYKTYKQYILKKYKKIINWHEFYHSDYAIEGEEEEVYSWNRKRFGYYIKRYDAFTKSLGKQYIHFLQPITAFKEFPTELEKKYPTYVNLKQYLKLESSLTELRKEGFNTFSLVDVFDGVKGPIFGDAVHFIFDKEEKSEGYKILIDKMVLDIAKAWNLKKK